MADLTWWRDELLDAIDERVTAEMRANPSGSDERLVWATIGGMSATIRELRAEHEDKR